MRSAVSYFLFFALLSNFFLPQLVRANMTGGGFAIYADSFSIVSDEYTTGGNFGLFGTAGEFGAGIIQSPIQGSIVQVDEYIAHSNLTHEITIGDGVVTTTFALRNGAGLLNGQLLDGVGPEIVIDWGGAASTNQGLLSDRIAQAINAETHNLAIYAQSDGVDSVFLTNIRTEGAQAVAIVENITEDAMTFSGMSQNGTRSLRGGFQAMELGAVSLTFNTTTVNLSDLTLLSVASSSITATVTSDGGYVLSAQEDGNLRTGIHDIDDVIGGAVVAGTEGYGIRTSGDDGQQNGADVALTGIDLTIASNIGSVVGEDTIIDFRAAIDQDSIGGDYSHIVTFTITSSL